MVERRERLKRVLDEALDLPAAERAGYLSAACGGDAGLRREVESLLAAHAEAGSFLGGEPPPSDALEQPGDTLAHYRLIELIGQGGFGQVWRAQQEGPIRRVVALKTIKGGMDTRQVIARFEAERQALALMEHPNIARIHDAGTTERGRPYFVMELVDGVPLTRYCDERRLSIRARVEIFLSVCAAVQHAHQKGVIHRDLKPANVLVEELAGVAVPKVIDFGIAKAVGAALSEHTVLGGLTREWGALGTPEYMAPEQTGLRGLDVDTRTDVYSLGALLYELLAGGRVFDLSSLRDTSLEELLRLVREVNPPRPSERWASNAATLARAAQARGTTPTLLRQALRGDLDWIVTRALEKDRERRYPSVEALARDVERYMAHEPVTAGPPSRLYRLKKFLRRNRLQASAGAAIAVALLAGLAAALAGLERARAGRSEAQRQVTIANATLDFLTIDLLSKVAPGKMGKDVTMRAVLDAAALAIEGRFQGEPLVEAAIRGTVGHTYDLLGLTSEAEKHLIRALELQERFDPGGAYTFKVARNLAGARHHLGRDEEAREMFERTLAAQVRSLGPEHEDTLVTCNNLGLLYLHMDLLERAETMHRKTLATRLRVLGEDHESTRVSMSNLAMVLQEQGRLEEAEEWILRELEACRKVNGEDHPSTLTSLNNLASLYGTAGREQEAEALLLKVVEADQRLLGPMHPATLSTQSNLATTYFNTGRFREARELLERLLEETAELQPKPLEVFRLASVLGNVLWALKRHDEAERLALEWIEAAAAAFGRESPTVTDFELLYGLVLFTRGRLEDAAGVLSEVSERLPPGSQKHADLQVQRGRCFARLGRVDEAEACFLEAVAAFEAMGMGRPAAIPKIAADLVSLYVGQGREADAAVWRARLSDP